MTTTELEPRVPATTAGAAGPVRPVLPDQLLETLQLVADGVVAVAGFAVAAIRIRRGDELELIVDTDLPEEVGTRIPLQLMLDELAVSEDWGALRFVPHELSSDPTGQGWVVSDAVVAEGPDAWHPMDMLVAPLHDAHGELRGTLAIDMPLDGRRPDAAARAVLERFAGLASRAVLTALERESLAEQVAMAETVKSIVRTTSAQVSLAGLLETSQQTLLDGFDARHVWIKTLDHQQAVAEHLPEVVQAALPDAIVELAEQAALHCWRRQVVMTVGRDHPVPPNLSQVHADHLADLLQHIGATSLVFVPLGAGPECMGSLVLTRDDDARPWTEVEHAALLDIGHDLGRAALNARTLDHEHALVGELKALDTYRSQLISTVSHELKSPLTTVQGHVEMLTEGTIEVGAEARSSLTAIGRASRRMSRVIDDLLLLRAVGDTARPLLAAPVDLRELVTDALTMTAMSVADKRLRVEVSCPDEPVLALGEVTELDKVVLNLLTNAVKYTPPHRAVRIGLEQVAGAVALVVSDEGLGISEADQAQLFTEFFRSTNPAAVAEPGTGLGLTIVRRIVERHGGTLDLVSALGAGSSFRVTLPAA